MARRIRMLGVGCLAGWLLLMAGGVRAEEPVLRLTIREHRFEPAELAVPAGVKFKLLVRNADSTAEEFESYSLNREKVIPGNTEAAFYIGPLEPGRYDFFGEFHMDTAKGWLIAR